MLKSISLALLLALVGNFAHADVSVVENAQVVAGIEDRIGRPLDADETAVVDALFSEVAQYQDEANAARLKSGDIKNFTFLGCVGGRIAGVFKRGWNICADRTGQTYLMQASGLGAIGFKATGDIVVHSGGREAIRGSYDNGQPISELEKYADFYKYGRVLAKFAGVNIDFFSKNDRSTAKLFFVGVSYGQYFEVGGETIVVE